MFISRLSPTASVAMVTAHVKKISQKVVSVHRLKTPRPTYASFVVKVQQADEASISSPSAWRAGTLIKPFLGRLHTDMILESTTEVLRASSSPPFNSAASPLDDDMGGGDELARDRPVVGGSASTSNSGDS